MGRLNRRIKMNDKNNSEKCSLCGKPANPKYGCRLMAGGNQLWLNFCDDCCEEAIDKNGMKICFRDLRLMGKPGLTEDEIINICDHIADTWDY